MEHAKITFAASAFAASLLGGVALGGYTVGGFHPRQPIDIIAEAAERTQPDSFDEAPIAQGPIEHVCTGCDARPFREDAWYRSETAHEEQDAVPDMETSADAVPAEDVQQDQDLGARAEPVVVTIADHEDRP
jgi:hypothetical protein